MIDFTKRAQQAEAMDDPELEVAALDKVFSDLNRTNALLGGQRLTINAVKEILQSDISKEYRIADMGCGDGDLIRRIALYCRKAGIKATFLGVDNSEAALVIARRKSAEFQEISYTKANILQPDILEFSCDILLCTLTLHHFSNNKLPGLLQNLVRVARQAIVIQDLERNKLAYYLFQLFSLIFIKTKIAKEDGLISIRSGFKKSELQSLSEPLGAWRHTIRWRPLFRYLWVLQAKASPTYD